MQRTPGGIRTGVRTPPGSELTMWTSTRGRGGRVPREVCGGNALSWPSAWDEKANQTQVGGRRLSSRAAQVMACKARSCRLGYILEEPGRLSRRVVRFLRCDSSRTHVSYGDEECVADEVDRLLGSGGVEFSSFLSGLRERYGGLQYFSESWSFEERITFVPFADLDAEDEVPMVSLIEHSVAHPFGVWVTMDGSVHFMFPTESGGEYVKVFSSIDSMIESDALMRSCRDWRPAAEGGADSLVLTERLTASIPEVREASGSTESWWESDGVRVHIWKTYAEVFANPSAVRWKVWVRDDEAAKRVSHTLG